MSIGEAKKALDHLINISRVDLYKPIQIAELLRRSRTVKDVQLDDVESYRNPSKVWRDKVTIELANKRCSSSQKYQDDLWNDHAMPPDKLVILGKENARTNGAVENYIYHRYKERQGTVSEIFSLVSEADPRQFSLKILLEKFVSSKGIKRSIDKAYEIITYALMETIVTALDARVEVKVDESVVEMVVEFADLTERLLGITPQNLINSYSAHVYRVGVTNAADRGLDMWANFGPAVQVKHLTLNPVLAEEIVDQVESDHIVVVCTDADKQVIEAIRKQIGWGKRVRGIVTETDLVEWYDRCIHGEHSEKLAGPLLELLELGFAREFPQVSTLGSFLSRRGYLASTLIGTWCL